VRWTKILLMHKNQSYFLTEAVNMRQYFNAYNEGRFTTAVFVVIQELVCTHETHFILFVWKPWLIIIKNNNNNNNIIVLAYIRHYCLIIRFTSYTFGAGCIYKNLCGREFVCVCVCVRLLMHALIYL
jgi:hypothetical protein